MRRPGELSGTSQESGTHGLRLVRMPHRVDVRFYAELNDVLPPDRRGQPITLEVAPGTTVKDLA